MIQKSRILIPKGKNEKEINKKIKSKIKNKTEKNEYDDFENGNDTKKIKAFITHNFCFIINIFHYILSSSLQENVPKYAKVYIYFFLICS